MKFFLNIHSAIYYSHNRDLIIAYRIKDQVKADDEAAQSGSEA